MLQQIKMKPVLALVILAAMISAAVAQAPQIVLRSVDGRNFSLADNRGKVVVLSFGATWVPLAAKELPALQKLADRYAGRDVNFYWVTTNSAKAGAKNYASDADLQAFARQHGWRLTVLRDPDQAAYHAFGLDALPTVVVIDREGKVNRKHVGFDPEQGEAYAEVIRSLDQLLK